MPAATTMLETDLKARARALGFDAARIARADDAWQAGGRLAEFVADGRHGDMGWMAETEERRAHPTAMWPEAKSALVVGLNYGPTHDPLASLTHPERATVSVYASNADYHDVLKKRLRQLASGFAAVTGHDVKIFVDTAPLMEKPLAERSGLGWQGKHTNLVSRDYGSWLFLGVMLTTAELEPDSTAEDSCGTLPRLSRHLPDQRLPRALPARCAALHLVSHHRTQGPDPARVPPRHGQPHLWLRRLPGRLPVEQVRAGGKGCGLSSQAGADRALAE